MRTIRPNGKSTTTVLAAWNPNRQALRVFASLHRRRKLRLLASTGLFSSPFIGVAFVLQEARW